MHIPDGFLSPIIFIAAYIITVAIVAFALYKLRNIEPRQLLLMGTLGAAVFGAQMLNFTIIGGTSGHIIGTALLTIVTGPFGAIVTMTVILLIQSLVFADGGLTALGANILNMGIIGALVTYTVYWVSKRINSHQIVIFGAIFLGSWLSVLIPALAAAVQLIFSGVVDPILAIAMMTFWHILIGFVEAVITVGAVYYLKTLGLIQIDVVEPDLETIEARPKPAPQAPVSFEGGP